MATTPLEQHIQAPNLDERIELFDLDATALGADFYRFTPMAFSNPDTSADVIWNGNTYSSVPMESSGWEVTGRGTVPLPHIKVANVNLAFSALAIAYGDLLGAVLTRRRTFRRYLDGQVDADPTVEFPLEIYKVNQKVNQNKVFIEWELSPSIDQEGRLLPGRPILQGACTHIYRRPDGAGGFIYTKATCPYTGTNYFDGNGDATTAALDVCSKRIGTGCKKRFTVLPTRAFPGAARTG
jgi:lambda family phage minor tail protein L